MADFDIVVLGSGGGPHETNLSGYLVKTSDASWDEGIISLEAGSGLGALCHILSKSPHSFCVDGKHNCNYTADTIFSFIRSYVITHAHLDHISSLILSAGSPSPVPRRIYAAQQTLNDLKKHIFRGRIWPDLASYNMDSDPHKLLYHALPPEQEYHSISPNISLMMMPVSHGRADRVGAYDSSAFFIRHDSSQREFLFFGDVESDSLSAYPQTRQVWRKAAEKIRDKKLNSIFIECSWPSGTSDDQLYAHLNPKHLVEELIALAEEVVGAMNGIQSGLKASTEAVQGVLEGIQIFIIHCKPDFKLERTHNGRATNHIICDQIRRLLESQKLGLQVFPVDQGTRIRI